MSWIATIPYRAALGRLKAIYDRVRSRDGQLDNVLTVHSLRPHTLEGHLTLYKNVLHHTGNTLPMWLLEAVAVRVSLLNGCDYCVEHHLVGFRNALAEQQPRVEELRLALHSGSYDTVFEPRAVAALRYCDKLTSSPAALRESDLDEMRLAGLDDGEILEINQVTGYFAYVNRTVLGLGVTTDGELQIGLSPRVGDDWTHN
jgi:uncharacterized peroxidase-related enzyme